MDVVVVTDLKRPRLFEQTLRTLEGHNVHVVDDSDHKLGVGGAKNKGAREITRTNKHVAFSDDDMYWMLFWDLRLMVQLDNSGVHQLGAWSHPYNLVTDVVGGVGKVNAAHGGGFIMTWEVWDKMGGFADNAHGPGKSEDWEFSQRIINSGGKVGCVYPFVALHCGLHNCLGAPATGMDVMKELVERQIERHALKGVVVE